MANFPDRLIQGYKEFTSSALETERARYKELAEKGQNPSVLIIACCDSRAAPETIFSAGPGELFVVRNVANLVPPYAPDGNHHSTSAAIEFAVKGLGVKDIVVMGHGRCGGIQAALSNDGSKLDDGDFIGKWMSLLAPVAEQVAATESVMTPAERQNALERVSIRKSVHNLRDFPYISEMEKDGSLNLHGAWFDISTAELWVMNGETGDFSRADS